MAKKSSSKAKRRRSGKARKVQTIQLAKMPTTTVLDIKTIWIDRMQIFLRSDMPLATISFSSLIPSDSKLVEVGRFQTTVPHLKGIVDVLCRTTDYYPTKSSAKPAS